MSNSALMNLTGFSEGDVINLIANLTGVLGIAANMLIYQQRSGKNLLIFKMISPAIHIWELRMKFLH